MKDKKISILQILIIIMLIAIATTIVVLAVSNNWTQETEPEEIATVNETKTESGTFSKNSNKQLETAEGITIVPTMSDTITTDSSWCGTFQLVWNDMKNEVVKKDIEFSPQLEMVENLNKEEFTEDMISEDYYYKNYGLKTLELKEEIEQGIKEKFEQTSDILDNFDWSEDAINDPDNYDLNRYFFYAMLYREFKFLNEFDELDNDKFGDEYDDVEYFGIDSITNEFVGNQIKVLYYNSQDDFAIIINTKNNDEVIFCENPEGSTFNEIYENMNNKADKYNGKTQFGDIDKFKAPKLKFDEEKEYKELQGKEFYTADGVGEIEQAIQTIQFELDEKGGKIKSEAAISTKTMGIEPKKEEPRYFYVDDTFALFLREKGRDLPYFATRIEDISKVQ